jgi:hypothetical protein
MTVTIEMIDSGVAVLLVDTLEAAHVDAFVDRVSALVQDRDEVNHVTVRVAGEPSHLLRYIVRVLDRQARALGKTVDLLPIDS